MLEHLGLGVDLVGRHPERLEGGWSVPCDRGRLVLMGREWLESALPGAAIPTLPYIAGYVLQCRDIDACRVCLKRNQIVYRELTDDVVAVRAPAALGGSLLFTGDTGAMPWDR